MFFCFGKNGYCDLATRDLCNDCKHLDGRGGEEREPPVSDVIKKDTAIKIIKDYAYKLLDNNRAFDIVDDTIELCKLINEVSDNEHRGD